MIYLSQKFFSVSLIGFGLLALTAWSPFFLVPSAGFFILLAFVTVFDKRNLFTRSVAPKATVVGRSSYQLNEIVELTVELEFLKHHVSGTFELDTFVNTRLVPMSPTARGIVERATSKIRFSMYYRARVLGEVKIEEYLIEQTSKLGLLMNRSRVKLEVPYKALVLPEQNPIPRSKFNALIGAQPLLLMGSTKKVRSSSPDIYLTSREYRYPDPLSRLDVRKLAKFGVPYTKVFESLESQNVTFVLDTGRATVGSFNGSLKEDYYKLALLQAAQHAVLRGDKVTYLSIGEKVRYHGALTSPFKLLNNSNFSSKLVSSQYDLLANHLIGMRRQIVIILTDISLPYVQEGLQKCIQKLAGKHRVLCLGLIEDDYDLNKALEVRSISDEADELQFLYRYYLAQSLQLFTRAINSTGGAAVQIPQEYWSSATLKLTEIMAAQN